MNPSVKKHLTKAKGYLERGDTFYRQAAQEMRAAKDAGATWVEIGDELGHSAKWATRIVAWAEIPANEGTPESPFARVENDHRDTVATKKVLREADEETLEKVVADLTPTQAAKVAAAADKKVQEHGKKERKKSDKKRREAIGDATVDELDEQQRIHDGEAELFKARRALRDGVAHFSEADLSELRDSWRDDLLATVADLEDRVGMIRLLLEGGTVNDAELEALLKGA